ncbi:MAG: glucose-6-phosphate dehydrogenase, partial [Deltaproteobacteria bacterium]|nr:glucose-6-phosphate dehydrogenase [Deltaproteobacteria bacterium]
TRRLLVPALLDLFREGLLPDGFALLGVSRTPHTDGAFREVLANAVRGLAPQAFDADAWARFAPRIFFQGADVSDRAGFAILGDRIRTLCAARGIPGNLLFYAAVAPKHYVELVRRLGEAGLAAASEALPGFRRLVVEKPFGNDEESARLLNREILAVFPDNAVFRIDHYLGKETVQNLFVFRFGNGIFEPLWNRNYIDHVQITAAESLGVESRADFYDGAGAMRDMVQNHLFQLLALVAMEPPLSVSGENVRREKLKLLQSVERVSEEGAGEACVRGQYAAGEIAGRPVPAYRAEKNVPPTSLTETYVALKLLIDNWRWGGVPFYLRTGKRLARGVTEIAIQFRPAPSLLFRETACGRMTANLLVINIQPDEGISLRFGAKVPGPAIRVAPVELEFTYREAFGIKSPPAYGRLLLDVMLGDPTLFPGEDAVETAWSILAPFLSRWREDPGRDLFFYPAGSWGPKEADRLPAAGGAQWRTP